MGSRYIQKVYKVIANQITNWIHAHFITVIMLLWNKPEKGGIWRFHLIFHNIDFIVKYHLKQLYNYDSLHQPRGIYTVYSTNTRSHLTQHLWNKCTDDQHDLDLLYFHLYMMWSSKILILRYSWTKQIFCLSYCFCSPSTARIFGTNWSISIGSVVKDSLQMK